jgi:hypothetical protein
MVMLGIMGGVLPFLEYLTGYLCGGSVNPEGWFQSISASFYSQSFTWITAIVFTVGMYLVFYRGYDKLENIMYTVAGIGAMLLVVFPCKLEGARVWNAFQLPMEVTNPIHLTGAASFFLILAWFCCFRFTKTSVDVPSFQKRARNVIYRVCGIGMVVSLAFLLLPLSWERQTWFGEMCALEFFCFAWITKSNTLIFRDKA